MRRVAITGMGAISAIGDTVAGHLDSLKAGRVGIGPITTVAPERLKSRVCAEVKGFVDEAHFDPRQLGLSDRNSRFALVAAREAVADAGDALEGVERSRAGVIFGASIGHPSMEASYERVLGAAPGVPQGAKPHPFTVPRAMPSSAASLLSMAHKIHGPGFAVASACSSATHAIGLAFQMIRSGMLEVALTGGAETPLTYGMIRSWEALRVLASDTCRPFSRDRSGLVLGEGAAVFVLEDLERAQARGARIHAELIGFGMTSDASDMTAPDMESAATAIAAAIADAGIAADAVDYVNAHGTGTQLNDKTETQALRNVLGNRLQQVPVSSSKSMYGHCLGASGALGLLATTLALREGFAPPTMNFREADPDCDLDCVPNAARPLAAEIAVSNTFAFGGLNAVLVTRAAG